MGRGVGCEKGGGVCCESMGGLEVSPPGSVVPTLSGFDVNNHIHDRDDIKGLMKLLKRHTHSAVSGHI